MEAILGCDSEAFQTFISYHYTYNSEETKSGAKSMFNMMKQTNPESLALKFVDHLGPFYDIYTRQVCSDELLSELLNDEDLYTWLNLSVSTQSTIKCMILDRMNHEDSEFISQELLRTVSKLV
ncbi:uncharacterized protein LOC142164121 [Nicotiana tabacum]|uniref:Uncharacterized protein LOC142164121 n=1 Tax=Nicotiana tabacum TaxID=4097 RepID=A0AC58RXE8_TOBAC